MQEESTEDRGEVAKYAVLGSRYGLAQPSPAPPSLRERGRPAPSPPRPSAQRLLPARPGQSEAQSASARFRDCTSKGVPRREAIKIVPPRFLMEKGEHHYLQKEKIAKGYILKRGAEAFSSRSSPTPPAPEQQRLRAPSERSKRCHSACNECTPLGELLLTDASSLFRLEHLCRIDPIPLAPAIHSQSASAG